MQNETKETIRQRVERTNQALADDIEWLETKYSPIKEAWIAAENRRRRLYEVLREKGMIGLFE